MGKGLWAAGLKSRSALSLKGVILEDYKRELHSFSEGLDMFLVSGSALIEEFLGSGERSTSDRSHDRLYLSLDLGLLTKKSLADPDLLKHP